MFALGDPEATTSLARSAGFSSVACEQVSLHYRLADSDDLRSYVSEFTGPVAMTISGLAAGERSQVLAETERRAEKYRDGTSPPRFWCSAARSRSRRGSRPRFVRSEYPSPEPALLLA